MTVLLQISYRRHVVDCRYCMYINININIYMYLCNSKKMIIYLFAKNLNYLNRFEQLDCYSNSLEQDKVC